MIENNTNPSIITLQKELMLMLDYLRNQHLSSHEVFVVLYFIILKYKEVPLRAVDDGLELYYLEKEDVETSKEEKANYFSIFPTEIRMVFEPIIEKIDIGINYYVSEILERIDVDVLSDNISFIFDTLLYRLTESEGKKSGEYIQPLGLTRFINTIIQLKPVKTIYNPFAGLASFGVLLDNNQQYYAQEINNSTWAIGYLRLLAYNKLSKSAYDLDNAIENWNSKKDKYDVVVAHPPFGFKFSVAGKRTIDRVNNLNVEDFLITNGLDSLSQDGRLISLVPTHFLHKTSKKDLKLKSHLIDNDLVETVISFPGGILSNTGVSFALLVLNKAKENKNVVRFIEASYFDLQTGRKQKELNYEKLAFELESKNESDVLKFVPNNVIKKQNYNLSIQRYFLKDFDGVKLFDLAQRTNVIRHNRKDFEKNNIDVNALTYVRIRDLKDDVFNYKLDLSNVSSFRVPNFAVEIKQSCLLLAVRWKTLKPTYFEYTGTPIFINDDIVPLTIDTTKVDIAYLINELQADYVQEQIRAFRVDSIFPLIKKNDLFDIKIKLPSLEEQKGKITGIYEASGQLKRLKEERNALAHDSFKKEFDEFASLKHSLGAPRQNILSYSEVLIKFFTSNKSSDFINLNTSFNSYFGEDLLTVFNGIKSDINYMSDLLEKGENGLVLENYNLEYVPIIELQKIIEKSNVSNLNFNLEIQPFQAEDKKKLGIITNKTLFKVLIDNILLNASKHGFVESNKSNHVLIELSILEDEMDGAKFVIEIKNNGKPFPENFDKSNFIAKYTTSVVNSTGIGGYDINRIANYFKNPDWELFLSNDNLYPVKFKFQFPLTFNQ